MPKIRPPRWLDGLSRARAEDSRSDYRAAMPLRPAVFGRPSMSPSWLSVPSELIVKTPIAPTPDWRLNRYLPSPLMVMSRLFAPLGRVLRIVPAIGVRAPFEATENPATVNVPALSTYTNFPLGVMAFQQLPSPTVCKLWVMGVSVPFPPMVYEEMLETSVPPG